jgi:hypothetical protein
MRNLARSSEPLAEHYQVPLLGVPVLYRSNSAAVIAVAARALARWGELETQLIEGGPPAGVDVVVRPGEADEPAAPFVTRAHGDTVLAAAGASMMTADLAHGAALAFVTPQLAADEARLRREVVEGLGLLLASARDRAPLDAAAVVRGGRAVLLVGQGEANIPALCYACTRAGFALLAADTVYVSLARGLRVWGHAGELRLPPETARLFPELAAQRRQTVAVEAERVVGHAERAGVCFVERGAGQASRVEPVPAAEAAARIAAGGAPAIAAAVAAGGAYRLLVGADPASAAALLAHVGER